MLVLLSILSLWYTRYRTKWCC